LANLFALYAVQHALICLTHDAYLFMIMWAVLQTNHLSCDGASRISPAKVQFAFRHTPKAHKYITSVFGKKMTGKFQISKKISALLVYGRPPLVFGGMICAVAVMWNRSVSIYVLGTTLLFVSMCCDMVDGWFATRYDLHSTLANLADRVMDKIVYSIIFPLVAVGTMWRLYETAAPASKQELLHAILVLILCVLVLIRDNFAGFMRFFGTRTGVEPENKEFTRLRTVVAAPVGVLLYIHAFYVPGGLPSSTYMWMSQLANLPLRILFSIEIIFIIITFGSIAASARKYGSYALDEICDEDELLRRRLLSFFPNSLTVMNAMMGLLALFFAYQGRMREMYLFLVGAALFDKLDGALARKLGLTTPLQKKAGTRNITLGGVLDDLADATSFCIVPAWIFFIALNGVSDTAIQRLPIGIVAAIYALAGLGRLAYFTLDRHPIPGFFKGLPTPAAALLVAAPLIILGQALDAGDAGWIRFWCIFCFGLLILAALIMNLYPIRYVHMGRFVDQHSWFGRLTLLLLIIFAFTAYLGYFALACMFFFLISPIFTRNLLSSADAAAGAATTSATTNGDSHPVESSP
jgi:phosphatidylserine synthase